MVVLGGGALSHKRGTPVAKRGGLVGGGGEAVRLVFSKAGHVGLQGYLAHEKTPNPLRPP